MNFVKGYNRVNVFPGMNVVDAVELGLDEIYGECVVRGGGNFSVFMNDGSFVASGEYGEDCYWFSKYGEWRGICYDDMMVRYVGVFVEETEMVNIAIICKM